MKIPLDLFLYLIKEFLNDLDIGDAAKKISPHIVMEDEEIVKFVK
jgi:hypothetical protein